MLCAPLPPPDMARRQVGPEAVLELTDIQKRFGSKQVLKSVSMTVRAGEVVSVIGPSGSGKTTLIEKLKLEIARLKRMQFGRSSEQMNEMLGQLELSLEELETLRAETPAEPAAPQPALSSGKPADIVAKMVDGSVQKYLKEVSLLDQVFVKAADGKQTVGQYLKSTNTTVKGFTLYVVGEGIEKKVDDFAAEVAAQVAAAKAAA